MSELRLPPGTNKEVSMKKRLSFKVAAPYICAAILAGVSGAGCVDRGVTTPVIPAVVADGKTRPPTVKPTPGDSLQFKDVTSAARIDYKWSIEGKHPLTILQTIGNGCALFDYDGDGNLDVLLVGPKLALYKGDGKGHFTDVTHATGLDKLSGHFLGCAVGDYDNDGHPDLYISAYRGGLLLHNESAVFEQNSSANASGTAIGKKSAARVYRDVTKEAGIASQPWGTSATFADFDNDGKLDLYIGNYVQFAADTQPQLCNNSGIMSSCGPRYYLPLQGVMYHNLGSGKFRDVTREWRVKVTGKTLGVAAADVNQNGQPMLAVANDEMEGDLLEKQGKTFHNVGVTSGVAYDNNARVRGGMGVDWGDYDNDGRLDLVIATFQHEPKNMYHNEGNGVFSDDSAPLGIAEATMPYVAFGCKFLDADNDGWLDLMFANGHVQDNIAEIDRSMTYKQPIQIFRNHEGSKFEDVSVGAGPAFQEKIVGRGLAVGDFDNDGRMDALVVDSDGKPMLLHNETPKAGHWLLVKLVGTKSNRDGIGALITAEAGGRKLLRRCASDGSYLSASDLRVHFGLGDATVVNLMVRWPGGQTGKYENIEADRIITLTEGEPVRHE